MAKIVGNGCFWGGEIRDEVAGQVSLNNKCNATWLVELCIWITSITKEKKERKRKREMCVPALSSLMDDMVYIYTYIYMQFLYTIYIYIYTHIYIYTYMHVCCCFSRVWLFVTPWTVTCQAPLFMGFSRQEYWSGLPCLPPRYLSNSGTEPKSPVSSALQRDSLLLSPYVYGLPWWLWW